MDVDHFGSNGPMGKLEGDDWEGFEANYASAAKEHAARNAQLLPVAA